MNKKAFLPVIFTVLAIWGCSDDFTILGYLNEPDLEYLKDAEVSGDESADLHVNPEDSSIWNGETLSFSVTGGVPPYYYVLRNGPGSIDGKEGIYSTASEGLAEIRIFDSNLEYRDASVQVYDNDPSSLWISPISVTLEPGQSIQFEAGGGDGNYTYSMYWPATTDVDGLTGIYTAPSGIPDFAQIRVADGGGAEAFATVVISGQAAFAASPKMVTLRMGEQVTIRVSGGSPPYAWTYAFLRVSDFVSGDDYVVYTPTETGTGLIEVTDDNGDIVYVSIQTLP